MKWSNKKLALSGLLMIFCTPSQLLANPSGKAQGKALCDRSGVLKDTRCKHKACKLAKASASNSCADEGYIFSWTWNSESQIIELAQATCELNFVCYGKFGTPTSHTTEVETED